MNNNAKLKKGILGLGRFIILAFFLLLVILPIYWMVITSFKTSPEITNAQNLTYFPKTFTLDNYKTLFRMHNYGSMLKNSLIVSVSTAVIVALLSIFGGYALARYRFRGKKTMLLYFLVTQMIPSILVMIPLYLIFSEAGLINTHIGLFIYYVILNLPFCVITMRSFFERIPDSLEESAQIDGCTKIQALVKVIIPIMLPGIVSVFVFAFIGAWNELIAGTIFISTPDMWTIPVGLKSLIGKFGVEWGVMMAGGVLALLPTAVVFSIMQKYIVEGMTAGAVKG